MHNSEQIGEPPEKGFSGLSPTAWTQQTTPRRITIPLQWTTTTAPTTAPAHRRKEDHTSPVDVGAAQGRLSPPCHSRVRLCIQLTGRRTDKGACDPFLPSSLSLSLSLRTGCGRARTPCRRHPRERVSRDQTAQHSAIHVGSLLTRPARHTAAPVLAARGTHSWWWRGEWNRAEGCVSPPPPLSLSLFASLSLSLSLGLSAIYIESHPGECIAYHVLLIQFQFHVCYVMNET